MILSKLKAPEGSKKDKKRVGRGHGSGWGKTAGRGHKGNKSRSGGNIPPGFEGGQMPLQRRIPKRGFRNRFREVYSIVNIEDLNRLEGVDVVDPEILKERGLIKTLRNKVKILGEGELKSPLHIKAHKFSDGAKKKIESAGGKVEVL